MVTTAQNQSPSQIMYATSINTGLRNRIEALVRAHYWSDTAANPTASVPLDALAWAVATNRTVLAGMTERIVDGNIGAAVDGISETDLGPIVLAALARLNGGPS